MNLKKTLLIAALLLQSSTAFGKIIFLDLNFSMDERKAAVQAAKANHEDIVFVPDLSQYSSQKIAGMIKNKNEWAALRDEMEADEDQHKPIPPEKKKRAQELDQYFLDFGVTQDFITDALKKHGAGGTKVIISGHSDGNDLQGAFLGPDTWNRAAVSRMLNDGGLSKSVKSIYSWGCYSGTQIAAQGWAKDFPNADMMIGYDTRSDLSGNGVGAGKLKRALEKEQSMRNAQNGKQILTLLEQADGNDKRHALSGRVKSCFVATDTNTVLADYSAPPSGCSAQIKGVSDGLSMYFAYSYHEKPLPKSGDDNSDIRKFYKLLQHSATCFSQCLPNPPKDKNAFLKKIGVTPNVAKDFNYDLAPCPGQVLLLLESDKVIHNYKRMYAKEFDFFEQLLKDKKVDPGCAKILTGNFSPSDSDLQEQIQNLSSCTITPSVPGFSETVQQVAQRMFTMITSLRVPFSWIDEQTDPTTSSKQVSGMSKDYDEITQPITKLLNPDPPANSKSVANPPPAEAGNAPPAGN